MNGPNLSDTTRAPKVGDLLVVVHPNRSTDAVRVVGMTPTGLMDARRLYPAHGYANEWRFKAWKGRGGFPVKSADEWGGYSGDIRRRYIRWPEPGELSALEDAHNAHLLRDKIAFSMKKGDGSLSTLRQIAALLGLEGE